MGRDLDFSDDARKQEAYEQVDFDRMEHECRQTEAACLRMDSPVVFNHDDMLAGNVLVPHDVRPHLPSIQREVPAVVDGDALPRSASCRCTVLYRQCPCCNIMCPLHLSLKKSSTHTHLPKSRRHDLPSCGAGQ